MKRKNYKGVFWGVVLIVMAVFMILDALSQSVAALQSDFNFFSLGICIFIFAWAVCEVIKGKLNRIFIPAGLIFVILQKNISLWCNYGGENFVSPWIVMLSALMLQVGASFIFSGLKKTNKEQTSFRHGSKSASFKNSKNIAENKLGSSVHYIDAEFLDEYTVINKLGSFDVYIENDVSYRGNGTLYVKNVTGELNIYVPSSWKIIDSIENLIGEITNESTTDEGPILNISGKNSMGNLVIRTL